MEDPKTVTIRPDGQMEIKTSHDGNVEVKSDKPINLDNMQLRAVSIENIVDLKSYGITTTDDRTMHILEFKDGGRFELTYSSTGTIENSVGHNIRATLQGGDTLIIGQRPGEST